MVILGIDPGLSVTGFALLRKEKGQTDLIDCGIITFSSKKLLRKRVGEFHSTISSLIEKHTVQHIALETPFLGKNAQNFLKLGYLRGVLYLLADQHDLSVSEFTPQQVKQAVTGSGAAPKEQVARALLRLFTGLEMPKKLDVTDALAVALCGAWQVAATSTLP